MNTSVFSRLQNCPTVSNGSFKAVGRLFQVDGPVTAKLLGPKLTVLVVDTSRSPWPAERRLRRVEAASRGTVIDDRYGGGAGTAGRVRVCCSQPLSNTYFFTFHRLSNVSNVWSAKKNVPLWASRHHRTLTVPCLHRTPPSRTSTYETV